MDTTPSLNLTKIENPELRQITGLILKDISAEKIICYDSKIHILKINSCFKSEEEQTAVQQPNNYYLLIIPSENEKRGATSIQQLTETQCKICTSLESA